MSEERSWRMIRAESAIPSESAGSSIDWTLGQRPCASGA